MNIIHREFVQSMTRGTHASTIAFWNDNPVIAWFGGSREGARDVGIYLQYNGEVNSFGSNSLSPWWNPILFTIKDDLYLFAKNGDFCDRWQTYLYRLESIHNIHPISILPAGLNGPVKTKPIVCDGKMYMGSSVETRWDWSSYIEVFEITMEQQDPLRFMTRSRPITVPKIRYENSMYNKRVERTTMGIIQPSLWLDEKDMMHAFFRSSRGLGKIYHSVSEKKTDYLSWSSPEPTHFPNPNSGVDTVCIKDRLFLVYNPDESKRTPLIVAELDSEFNILDYVTIGCSSNIKKHTTQTDELSYPYMIEQDGCLHLTYTYGRSKIEYIVIEI